MEMALDKLSDEEMPDDEKEFIAAVRDLDVPEYATGFCSEQNLQKFLRYHFSYLNQYSDLALIRTGSSGRYEGFALGDAEFVLVVSPGHGESPLGDSLDELRSLLERSLPIPHQPWETKVSVEIKDLNSDLPLAFYEGNAKGRPYPGRVLESEFVAGSSDVFWESRKRVFDEIIENKRILRVLKAMRREHRLICETGVQKFKGKELRHLDVEHGIVFHDPPNNIDGLKRGFLRYVQIALSIEIFGLVVRKQIPVPDVVDLNQSVEERIRYCFRKGWVKEKEPLINAGCAYIELAALQGVAKWNNFRSGHTKFQLEQPDHLKIACQQIVHPFQTRLLID